MDEVRAGEGRERKCVYIGKSNLDEVFSAQSVAILIIISCQISQ